ncbi:hypothetical protein [Methanobrevibacter sp. DSM 116169]|uniref:hypothetical protein n=1 Tax=Methanobrevibacter sp. DSM 116169 TaxID=3242727 RepID=UPI0038FC3449
MEGVLKVEELSNEDILNLIEIESKRADELVPVINEGLKECFRKDYHMVLFADNSFKLPNCHELLLVNDEGIVVGKYLNENDNKEDYQDLEDYEFLSDDFVLFKDKMKGGIPFSGGEYFLIPGCECNDLMDLNEVCESFISMPSVESDYYLKNKFSFNKDSNIATIIVSYSLN